MSTAGLLETNCLFVLGYKPTTFLLPAITLKVEKKGHYTQTLCFIQIEPTEMAPAQTLSRPADHYTALLWLALTP